jgi:D-glycero-alpha-D-manno-heptose-7-phosphate kinase
VIITETPLRISLAGGGTDVAAYYRKHGGRVVNCAINKFVYVIVKKRYDDMIYVNYSRKEIVPEVGQLQHDLVREAMLLAGVKGGVEITTLADIPSAGSGLGSSSAVTVGLLHALFLYRGRQLTADELARFACKIEIDCLGKPMGKQDAYITAHGGIRDVSFGPDEAVTISQLEILPADRRALERELMLFYTGITRSAGSVLKDQIRNTEQRLEQLHTLRRLAGEVADGLTDGRVGVVGTALYDGWQAKRELAVGIAAGPIDDMINAAMKHGATGAKVCGAGGGGFVLVACSPERQQEVRDGLSIYRELPIQLISWGSRVVFNNHREVWD